MRWSKIFHIHCTAASNSKNKTIKIQSKSARREQAALVIGVCRCGNIVLPSCFSGYHEALHVHLGLLWEYLENSYKWCEWKQGFNFFISEKYFLNYDEIRTSVKAITLLLLCTHIYICTLRAKSSEVWTAHTHHLREEYWAVVLADWCVVLFNNTLINRFYSVMRRWRMKKEQRETCVIELLSFLSQIIVGFAELVHRTCRLNCSLVTSVFGFLGMNVFRSALLYSSCFLIFL